jgi:hypothetical protein
MELAGFCTQALLQANLAGSLATISSLLNSACFLSQLSISSEILTNPEPGQ